MRYPRLVQTERMSVRKATGRVHISTLVTTFRAVMRPTAADDALWYQESGPSKHLSHGQGHLARDWYTAVVEDSFSNPSWLGTHQQTSRFEIWVYEGQLFVNTDLTADADDVSILIQDIVVRDARTVERARSRVSIEEQSTHRQPIPDDVKLFVWQRDEGRCVRCRSNRDLEFDHIIPLAMGGSSTARNLQLLCEPCNREKGANLV